MCNFTRACHGAAAPDGSCSRAILPPIRQPFKSTTTTKRAPVTPLATELRQMLTHGLQLFSGECTGIKTSTQMDGCHCRRQMLRMMAPDLFVQIEPIGSRTQVCHLPERMFEISMGGYTT